MLALLILVSCGGSDPSAPPSPTDTGSATSMPSAATASTGTVVDSAGTVDSVGSVDTTATADTSPPHTGVATCGVGAVRFVGACPTNVLMVSIDTLRLDHITPYDDGRGLMPTLGEYIAGGVSADDAMQCSNWTMASTSCTVLGQDHVERGFLPKLTAADRLPYPEGTRFLATELTEAGYHTVLTSRNGFFSTQEDVNNAQGYLVELDAQRSALGQLQQGLDALTKNPTDRWFLHVHVTEPHAGYSPPEEYLTATKKLDPIPFDFRDNADVNELRWNHDEMPPDEVALAMEHLRLHYEGEVRYLDDQLAEGLAAFDAAGLLDDTLVVFWTDHGEQFLEHDALTHAYDLHAEENDALFALWAHNIVPGVVSEPVSLIDLAPTVLAALELPPGLEMTGHPLGTAPPDRDVRMVSVARGEGHNALRRGDHKLVFDWTTGRRHLYDTVADPGETNDLFVVGDPLSDALWTDLRSYVEATELLAPEVVISWPAD
mgnify:CR=1 FL=1